MEIRCARQGDVDQLVEIDKKAYGEFGAGHDYFERKFKSFPQGILVVEEDDKVTGFTVIELLDENKPPEEFTDLITQKPFNGKWMHIVAFTTATNYKDVATDSKLVTAAENVGRQFGCVSSCVPLTKTHPFEGNGVFGFWKTNGYEISGGITWVPSSTQKMECFLYRKDLM